MAKAKKTRTREGEGEARDDEQTAEEKSQAAAAEVIAAMAEQILEKAPRGLLETGYFQPDPDDLANMPSGPVDDGLYSDKQLVVRFEDGKPVEIWRSDCPSKPDGAVAVGNVVNA
jgi:hypothetical protein